MCQLLWPTDNSLLIDDTDDTYLKGMTKPKN